MPLFMRFRLDYFLIAILLFITEVVIAIYFRDHLIRGLVGDFLVVILMYFSLRSIFRIAPLPLAIGILLFSFIIEGLQYLHFLHWIGWQDSLVARIIFGTTYETNDLLAYLLGVCCAVFLEQRFCTTPNETS
ncbi:MAG: DUF2809 domain-containing protein [Bacteroidota bacterium]